MAAASMITDVMDRTTIPNVNECSAAPMPNAKTFKPSSATVNNRLSRSLRPTSGRLLIGFATVQKIKDGAMICAYSPASCHSGPNARTTSAWPAAQHNSIGRD